VSGEEGTEGATAMSGIHGGGEVGAFGSQRGAQELSDFVSAFVDHQVVVGVKKLHGLFLFLLPFHGANDDGFQFNGGIAGIFHLKTNKKLFAGCSVFLLNRLPVYLAYWP